ncbi:hypothetical protein MNEG_4050 [Monoraphidium neglectum]|uniref:Uncharacterized protein n=1 Tax=Monoraphidium neglectum TaxID=145388 RepID=A0A0D2NFK6_9CHLO|nr:hypothetical protein MNEG_4050 [Monoraphidium neglectum]KIZ03911.1 hypothetical protein MNEG_4050 [Monoraphidium neglectum]|eukprot:XP_013902930.1 hypothetical protein MNEG_4050 [Monoraphidium neglectum]
MVTPLADFFKSLFDYDSWAPKSSRIWRLNQYQPPEADSLQRGAPGGDQDAEVSLGDMRVLQDRLAQLRADSGGGGSSGGATAAAASAGLDAAADGDELDEAGRSFSSADDNELTFALNQRISQIAATTGDYGSSTDEADMRRPLTGEEFQQLLMSKYGKLYDVSFAKRSIPGKTFVSLNIMWLHLGQRSFKLSPEQYAEKLAGVSQLVNVLGQTDKVRAFLNAPAKAQKGLPPRPVVGTAVSVRLDLDDSQVEEWFGAGFD